MILSGHLDATGRAVEGVSYVLAGAFLFSVPIFLPALGFVAFISTVPWILLVLRFRKYPALLAFTALSYVVTLVLTFWIKHFDPGAWFIAPLFYMPFFLAIWAGFVLLISRFKAGPVALLWALLFTSLEWIRSKWSPGEISLGQLGYGIIAYDWLTPIVDIFGVSVLTFLLAGTAGTAVDLARWIGCPRHRERSVLWPSAFFLLLFCGASVYGLSRHAHKSFQDGPTIAVIQPNVAPWTDHRSAAVNLNTLRKLTYEAIAIARADLVVWPENAIADIYLHRQRGLIEPYKTDLIRIVTDLGIPLVVDGASTDDAGHHRHTTTAVYPDGSITQYDKAKLVPWSEYVPFAGVLSSFSTPLEQRLVEFIKIFNPAIEQTEPGLLDNVAPFILLSRVNGSNQRWTFGIANCFEIASVSVLNSWHSLVQGGERGVHFIVNPTNEVLLGTAVHAQMLTIAQFRAMEYHSSVIRAANNGITALIDPDGTIRDLIRDQVTGAVAVNMPGFAHFRTRIDNDYPTVYARIGDVFPLLCCLILGVVLLREFGSSRVWR